MSPDKASVSLHKKHCVKAEVIYLAIVCCLATIEVALWQLFENSSEYHVCRSLFVGI